MLNGEVKVMLTKVCSLQSVLSRDSGPREKTYLGDIIRAVLSWDLCLRNSGDGSRIALGSGWDRERVGPCSVSSRMLN